ncbi:MAG: ribulose-phosphate 3-epimerase [Christensenellaceae bacterium]|jgi:ribulose-phosphate 3-epimerase|nr:ribulose-phosphate 3-epimerase [Christensenellaceae bacterium]
MQALISPSLMCADLLHLEEDLLALKEAGAAFFHFDVMDGAFVPNFCLGPDLLAAARKAACLPADLHLMIESPERHLQLFSIQPGDVVSIHAESTRHLQKALGFVRAAGGRPALALNPATPLSILDEVAGEIELLLLMTVNPGFAGQKMVPGALGKIRRAREKLDAMGFFDLPIEVDGNVSLENATLMRAAGASVFVAGTSSVFRAGRSIQEGMLALQRAIEP